MNLVALWNFGLAFWFFLAPIPFCEMAFAQNKSSEKKLVDRVYEGTSSAAKASLAKKEILDSAIETIVESMVRSKIGEARSAKSRGQIRSVISQNTKFIPYVNPGELETLPDGTFKMRVNLKISESNLLALMQEQGLLTESEGSPVVLPLITFNAKGDGRLGRWWENLDSAQLDAQFEENLQKSFLRQNVFVFRPIWGKFKNRLNLPGLKTSDFETLGKLFGASLVVRGEIKWESKGLLRIHLEAWHLAARRVVAEITREFYSEQPHRKMLEVSDSIGTDLAQQILEAWQRGTLGTNEIMLVVKPGVDLEDQDAFIENVKSHVVEIKSMRERAITADEISYLIQSTLSAKDLYPRLHGFVSQGKMLNVTGYEANKIVSLLQNLQKTSGE